VIESAAPGLTMMPVGPDTLNVTFCVVEFPNESVTLMPAVN
jgi:hypothetical protein